MKSLAWSALFLIACPSFLRAEAVTGGWPLSAWIGRLVSWDYEVRATAAYTLPKIEDPAAPAVPRMIELLSDA